MTIRGANHIQHRLERKGGDKIELVFNCSVGKEGIQSIADNIYRSKIYSGYEGSFDAWLVPYCDAGYLVTLEDASKGVRPGKYYVTSVAVEFSSSGAKRTVSLGSSLRKD